MTVIGRKIKNNKEGLGNLLKFLKTIYKADEMADAFSKYVDFEKRKRENGEKIQEFVADWENLYTKVKAKGCVLADMVLAFKLLQACKLSDIETNLVLTGINFDLGRSKENVLHQTKESLKKFIGRAKIVEEKKEQVW